MKHTGLNKYIKISINYFLGPLLFLWVCYSIYLNIRQQADFSQALQYIREAAYGKRAIAFWMVVLLMLVNWGLEARKWQVLLLPLERIGMWRSFKAIMTGVALALNTPNRVGEYGGRILYVGEGKRIQAISLTVVGSFSQLLITVVMGSMGFFFLKNRIVESTITNGGQQIIFYVLALTGAAGVFLYFRLGGLLHMLEKIPALSSVFHHLAIIKSLHVTILLRVIGLSMGRYLVFVIQYYLLLRVMHVEIDWWPTVWASSILFLVLAVVPTIALVELGLRWTTSMGLFKLFSSNFVGIYATATGIWLINLVIPALAGSLLLLGIKIFKDRV